jgi:hypothetical protein
MLARAGSLGADAHQRDTQLSEHAFTLVFDGIAIGVLLVAVFALLAVRALWVQHSWGWWYLTVLTGLDVLSTALRPSPPWRLLLVVPSLAALVGLLTPSGRAYVRHERIPRRDDGDGGWSAGSPSYADGDEWLQGR